MPKSKKYSVAIKNEGPFRPGRFRSAISFGNLLEPDIIININNNERFGCKICDFISFSRFHFHQHMKRHKATCCDCEQTFRDWKSYSKHIAFCMHRFGVYSVTRPNRPVEIPAFEFKHQCKFCFKKFIHESELLAHQKKCRKRLRNKWVLKL